MSFSSEWLRLREPVDHAARDTGLIAQLAQWCAGKNPVILDLGSGTGSSYRALAPQLGGRWTMTDIDAALLQEASSRHQGETTFATTQIVDLEADLEDLIAQIQPDVICGSALIDLASAEWLDRLAAALPAGAAFYMALSYDGKESWTPEPPHEADAQAAFLGHQHSDKGFGPALGPDAAAYMAALLAARGYQVSQADSPWQMGAQHAELIGALATGSAQAVSQTGALSAQNLADWEAGRKAARHVTIGHLDLLALPA